jgi:iron(III) transport system substrate-binding protein
MRSIRGWSTCAVVVTAITAAGVAGCGGSSEEGTTTAASVAAASTASTAPAASPAKTTSTPAAQPAGGVTPVSAQILADAEKEGSLVLYTNADDEQVAPLVKAFNVAYPDLKVKSLSLGSNEVFQRYLSESATGSPSADVLLASNAVSWQELMTKGDVDTYQDPNLPNLPGYAKLGKGVTAMSEDPSITVYNKALIPESKQPSTLAGLAAMASSLKGKIATVDVGVPLQLETTAAYVAKTGDAGWQTLEKLGAASKVESSTGALVTKLAQGQYAAAFFTSGAVRALITGDAAKLVDWKYMTDATVVVPRAIAVTKGAKSPNAAKVFQNWVLSVQGQQAECQAGFTPFRNGVDCPVGLSSVDRALGGPNKTIVETYDGDLDAQREAITSRWNAAFGR